MNGPAGEVPVLSRTAGEEQVHVLWHWHRVSESHPKAFRDLGVDRIPGTGLLPVVVPGAFDAWMKLLRDYGTFRPHQVLEYAIGYARRGFAIAPTCADAT